jgi:hypothetical protein
MADMICHKVYELYINEYFKYIYSGGANPLRVGVGVSDLLPTVV